MRKNGTTLQKTVELTGLRVTSEWKTVNKLDLHECNDLKTVQFVPAKIHEAAHHIGGRYEAKCKKILESEGSLNG